LPVQILAGGAVYVALFFAQGFHAALNCGNLFLRLAHVLRGIVRLTHFSLHISGEGEGFFLPRKERIKQGFCLSAVTCAVDHQPQRIESSGKCCFCFVHRTLAQGALAAGFFLPGKGLTQVVAGIVIQRCGRRGQQVKSGSVGGHLAFCAFHFAVALGEAVHCGLMGRGGGAHFPSLAFNILAGKEGAVGGPYAVARPVRPEAREFAAEVFLRAQQGFFLRGQGA